MPKQAKKKSGIKKIQYKNILIILKKELGRIQVRRIFKVAAAGFIFEFILFVSYFSYLDFKAGAATNQAIKQAAAFSAPAADAFSAMALKGPYVKQDKISLKPENGDGGPQEAEIVPGEVIVKFKTTQKADEAVSGKKTAKGTIDMASAPDLKNRLEKHKISKAEKISKNKDKKNKSDDRDKIVKLKSDDPTKEETKKTIEDLKNDPNVEYVEPNYIMKTQMIPNDPYYQTSGAWGQDFRDLWGLQNIQAESAWDTSQGEGVVVAVSDTGVDYSHEDIAENIWTNAAEVGIDAQGNDKKSNGIDDDGNGYVDDWHGWDFVTIDGSPADNDPMDDNGHGTHVAGTIAAVGGNSLGIIGVAPKAKIMPVKGLGVLGGSTSDLVNTIYYAADNGADIINCSWGGYGQTAKALIDAINYAHDVKGVTIVAAAGNSNYDVGDESYGFSPANIRNVITVSAVDHANIKSSFSNYGKKIDVAAPGGGDIDSAGLILGSVYSILSLKSSLSSSSLDPYIVGGKYLRIAGTSMASPHAAGVAALIKSLHQEFTPEQIRSALRNSSDDIGEIGFDFMSGSGRVNALKAMQIDPASFIQAKISYPFNKTLKTDQNAAVISGVASGPSFDHYQLFYASDLVGNSISWTALNQPILNPVNNGDLGVLPISQLGKGYYYLQLVVSSNNGFQSQDFTRFAIDDPFAPIANDTAFNEYHPRISGNKIVWMSYPAASQNSDIWLNDLTDNSKTQITNHPNAQEFPDISGDLIVWEDYRNIPIGTNMITSCFNRLPSFSTDVIYNLCDSDIYLYDTTTKEEVKITNDSAPETKPVVSGNRIAWLKHVYYNSIQHGFTYLSTQIWTCVYDKNTKTCPAEMLTDGSSPADNLAISGDRILTTVRDIWFGWPIVNAIDAVTKNINTKLAPAGSFSDEGAISGDYAVISDAWPGHGSSSPSLYLYNFKTNTSKIIKRGNYAYWPSISGDNIVWYEWDRLAKSWQVYFYNISAGVEKRLTYSLDYRVFPHIFDNRIVWEERTADSGYSSVDIYTTLIEQIPPNVSITIPNNNAYLKGSFAVQVAASDDNGIAKVEFYKDSESAPLTTDTMSPFEATYTNLTDGAHTIKAVAYDIFGNFSFSEVVINVDAILPVAKIISPQNKSAVRGVITVEADASDNNGIEKAEFLVSGKLIGSDSDSPFTIQWDTTNLVNNAAYSLSIKAYDLAGNVNDYTDSIITIDTGPPKIFITSPRDKEVVSGNGVPLLAYAYDNYMINKVEFYIDDSLNSVAIKDVFNFSTNWDILSLAQGSSHSIYAKAYDSAGNTAMSSTINVIIKDGDAPAITQNMTLDSYIKGIKELNITATDNIGIVKVEFYADNTLLGSSTAAPYAFSLDTKIKTNGTHTFFAKAYDAAGNAATSQSVISIIDNSSPSVPGSISSSINASIQPYLTWKVSSDNSAVSGYKIYRDDQLISPVSSSVLNYTDTSASVGQTYSYSISSIDMAGNESAKSNPVSVNVVSAPANQNANSSPPLNQNANTNNSVSQNINSSPPLIKNSNFNANISINRNTNVSIGNNANVSSRNNANTNQGGITNNNINLSISVNDNTNRLANNNPSVEKDITPPIVSIISPASSNKVAKKSIIALKASAIDDVGVEKVEFYANSRLLCSDDSVEYSCDWKVSAPGNPAYDIQAKAYDAAGNASESEIVKLYLKSDSGVIVSESGGSEPVIRILQSGGSEVRKFLAYEKQFRGGVSVKTADLDNDGREEIITAPGKGRESEARIFNFEGNRIDQFLAYGKSFKGGINIAVADFEGDGNKEIVVSPQSGSPRVMVFGKRGGKWKQITPSFLAFASNMKTGVNVVSGDFDGDGKDEIAAVSGRGSISQVKIFGLRGNKIKEVMPQFAPFGSLFKGGINLAAGDINGDWKDEIIASPASQGSSTVRVFDFYGNGKRRLLIPPFFAFDKNLRSGANLGSGDFDGDGKSEIIASMADKGQSLVRIFSNDGKSKIQEFKGFEQSITGGARVERW